MNVVVRNNNAAKIIDKSYQDYIKDRTLGDSADDIIATYFDESIDTKRAEKMI